MRIENIILIFVIILVCLHVIFEMIHFVCLRNRKGKIIINNDYWYGGIFYYNPNDKRVIIPKRIAWLGWTLNFARPSSIIIIALIVMVIVLGMLK